MRRSFPLVIALGALGCATAKPAATADCRRTTRITSYSTAANDLPLDPTATFGPSAVILVHPDPAAIACR